MTRCSDALKGMPVAQWRAPSTWTDTQAVLRRLVCLQKFTSATNTLDCDPRPRPWTVNTRPTQLECTQTLGHLSFLSLDVYILKKAWHTSRSLDLCSIKF